MWTDEERIRLDQLKRTARQREPLPDEKAIALAMGAAAQIVGAYLCEHEGSPLWTTLARIGDPAEIAIELLTAAHLNRTAQS
jgi:hypothetical protein